MLVVGIEDVKLFMTDFYKRNKDNKLTDELAQGLFMMLQQVVFTKAFDSDPRRANGNIDKTHCIKS